MLRTIPLGGGRTRALIALLATAALLGGCGGSHSHRRHHYQSDVGPSTGPAHSYAPGATTQRPNIVFVLTDDLSRDLIPFMPQVQSLATRGLSFDNYFVSDSLCCPSRASIFTGNFPHDTHIYGNTPDVGGFSRFYERDEQAQSFNVALQHAGYATAMMGKYLNGYLESGQDPAASGYVPPGWNEWDVAGFGYPEFDYPMNIDGTVHHFGHAPGDYLTDVMADRGARFINREAHQRTPFFLELATFAPHRPYTPAPQDRHDFPGLGAPEPPNFDVLPTHAPRWLQGHPPLSFAKLALIDRAFRRRAQSVQAVDRMIDRIESTLAADHLTQNTYIVFSSDNGLHTGEYRLTPGKLTAFDTDIRVPLIVAGPGVPVDRRTNLFGQNIDLADTFDQIGGATPAPNDGTSLLPVWHGHSPRGWQNAALVEHRDPTHAPRDPDAQTRDAGNPTSYIALRTGQFLWVEYIDGEREFYNLHTDPFELHNVADKLSTHQRAILHRELARLHNCHGHTSCQAAARVPQLDHVPH